MRTASLSQLLQLKKHNITALVGAGGKTSIINLLAQQNQKSSVLISPTTKIYSPEKSGTAYSRLFTSAEECLSAGPKNGITYGGVLNPSTQKLSSFPQENLAQICKMYDFSFLEADGSRSLPCKGWQNDEPVIPSFVTDTIGVITVNALGKPANESNVLHLPLFLALTGLQANSPITIDALTQMVTSETGMFKSSLLYPSQRLHLIINQIENTQEQENALSLAKSIQLSCTFSLKTILVGSALKNTWQLMQ